MLKKSILASLVILIIGLGVVVFKNEKISRLLKAKLKMDQNSQPSSKLDRPILIGVVVIRGPYEEAFLGLKDSLSKRPSLPRQPEFNVKVVSSVTEEIKRAAQELLSSKPDLIYTVSTPVTTAVAEVVKEQVPIVFNIVGDPIGAGFAKSYSDPGKNMTGCSNLSAELSGKRLEMFHDAFPVIQKVVTFYNPGNPFSQLAIVHTREAALKQGLRVDERIITDKATLVSSLESLQPGEYNGIYVIPDAIVVSNIDSVVQKADQLGIPTMAHEGSLAEKGVTITYGAGFYELGSQCSESVIGVLEGIPAKSIPILTPEYLEVVVNMKAVDRFAFILNPSFLARADRVIR